MKYNKLSSQLLIEMNIMLENILVPSCEFRKVKTRIIAK